jgi:hypothetical protein
MSSSRIQFIPILLLFCLSVLDATLALASPAGDTCRKEICDSAVTGCMRADQSLNPYARTETEKKSYCAQFFNGCMSRNIVADVPWYTPEMVARFLRCPS